LLRHFRFDHRTYGMIAEHKLSLRPKFDETVNVMPG